MATGYLKNKQKLKGIRYMLLAIAAINALITVILGIVSSFFENPIPMYLQSLIIGLCAYLIPLVVYAKTTGVTVQAAEEKFYLKRCKPYMLAFALVLGVCWQFVMVVISLPASFLFGGVTDAAPDTLLSLAAAVFVVGVIPAVFEEFLFRGIVDGSMSEFNTRAAVIFSSVMFAFMHADIYNFIGYIIMGVILTSIVRRTGSVYTAMMFHFANNVTALLLGYFNPELMYAPAFTIGIFVAAVFGFFLVYAAFISVTKNPKKVSVVQTATLLGQSFVNLPVLLCFILLAGAIILMRVV